MTKPLSGFLVLYAVYIKSENVTNEKNNPRHTYLGEVWICL